MVGDWLIAAIEQVVDWLWWMPQVPYEAVVIGAVVVLWLVALAALKYEVQR